MKYKDQKSPESDEERDDNHTKNHGEGKKDIADKNARAKNSPERPPHHPQEVGGLDEWEFDNLPNRLTLFRILLIPVIVFSLTLNLMPIFANWHAVLGRIAGWTFVIASITDFFDGYIARKRNIVTVFGSFLDPIADKLLVVSSLILLQALQRIHVLVVIVLVLREMYITALRLLAKEKGLALPVDNIGKWKTALQMVGIPMLMANDNPLGISMLLTGQLLIYIATGFSVYSATTYSLGLLKKIQLKRKEAKIAKRQGHLT